jgi:hypothetical protein
MKLKALDIDADSIHAYIVRYIQHALESAKIRLHYSCCWMLRDLRARDDDS